LSEILYVDISDQVDTEFKCSTLREPMTLHVLLHRILSNTAINLRSGDSMRCEEKFIRKSRKIIKTVETALGSSPKFYAVISKLNQFKKPR